MPCGRARRCAAGRRARPRSRRCRRRCRPPARPARGRRCARSRTRRRSARTGTARRRSRPAAPPLRSAACACASRAGSSSTKNTGRPSTARRIGCAGLRLGAALQVLAGSRRRCRGTWRRGRRPRRWSGRPGCCRGCSSSSASGGRRCRPRTRPPRRGRRRAAGRRVPGPSSEVEDGRRHGRLAGLELDQPHRAVGGGDRDGGIGGAEVDGAEHGRAPRRRGKRGRDSNDGAAPAPGRSLHAELGDQLGVEVGLDRLGAAFASRSPNPSCRRTAPRAARGRGG